MPHKKRVCIRKGRPEGRDPNRNYTNDRIAMKAIRKEKMAKQARKRNRK